MAKLYVIRHAQVQIDPNISSEQWEISTEGILSTKNLIEREILPEVRNIYHSPELKAQGTAKIIAGKLGLQPIVHSDLRELKADIGYLPHDQFVERVGSYLEGFADNDFENYEIAAERIEKCIKQLRNLENGHSFAIVSHGRILTLLFSRILGVRLGRKEWQSIKSPDLSIIDLESLRVEKGFLSSSQSNTGPQCAIDFM